MIMRTTEADREPTLRDLSPASRKIVNNLLMENIKLHNLALEAASIMGETASDSSVRIIKRIEKWRDAYRKTM